MNRTGRTVAKNIGVLLASQVVTWALAILLTIFLPQYLGPADLGRYQLASSIWAIAGILVAFGMDTFLTKEIARAPEAVASWFSVAIILRAGLLLIGFLLVGVYAILLDYSPEMLLVIFIIGLANVFLQFIGPTQACLQGLERMEFLSLSDIISKAFLTATTIILLVMGYRVIMVSVVLAISALIALVVQLVALHRIHPLSIHVHWPMAGQMLHSSLPYLVNVGIRTAYLQIDILIISWVASETVIGWYGVASRLFATLLFIPSVLMAAVFPAMSRTHSASPEELPSLVRKNFDLMLLFGVPIGFGLFLVADPAVRLLFGPEFVQSGPVLAIMGIVLVMTYQNMLLGQYLISTDRQNTWTWVMAIACLVTVPLDFYLIPLCERLYQNGAIGGAISFLVTELGMTLFGATLLPKGTLRRSNAWLAVRILAAGLLMVVSAWGLRQMFIAIPILVGACVYLFLVWALRIIPKEDWELLQSLLHSVLSKLRKSASSPTKAGGPL
jgi:O-antigen/teichoic acid export membrane protein